MIRRRPSAAVASLVAIVLGVTACNDDDEPMTSTEVEPPACDAAVDVILDAGQHQTYDGDTCLLLPAGGAGDRYRVAVIRPTLIEDEQDTPDVWLEISAVAPAQQSAPSPVAPPPTAGPAPSSGPASTSDASSGAIQGIDGGQILEDLRILRRTRRFHTELRDREADLPLRLASASDSDAALASGPALADPPATDDLFLELECSTTAEPTPVTRVDFNEFVAIYQDSASHAAEPMSTGATGDMLSYYASYVADFTDQYWGQTPDTDGNGRVIVSTAPVLADTVAAAVFSGDFNSTTDCASSNEGEIIYFSETVMRNLDPANSDDQSFLALSVLAHEMKHVTSLFHAVARGSFHNTWIEEGTAEIAQTMSSRIAWAAVGGPPVGSEITGNDIIEWNNSNNGIGREAWGVVLQLADLIVHLSTQPNSLTTNPEGASDRHTFYAGGWHWHRFMGDAFGNASTARADSALFREMTDSSTSSGTGALLSVTGRSFEQLFEDVIVAASFHKTPQTPARAFTTWDLTTATAIFAGPAELSPPHRYPWPVTTDVPTDSTVQANPTRDYSSAIYSCPPQIVGDEYQEPAETDRCAMGPSGIRFHDFVSDGTVNAEVQVFGAENGQIIVTRLN